MENYIYELNSDLSIVSSSSENKQNSIEFGATVIPIYLNINDQKNPDYNPKCIAMILDFGSIPQDVGEIYFKNYYTYIISILVMKISTTDSKRLKKWYIAIRQKVVHILSNHKSSVKMRKFYFLSTNFRS